MDCILSSISIVRLDSNQEYYCTEFSVQHEASVLFSRQEITDPNKYGSEPYSKEELTAHSYAR